MNCNQTEVSMNVISNRKKMLQSKNKNVDYVCTCFLIWLEKLKQKAPTNDKRHICCSKCTACEAAERTVHFTEALMDNELGATFGRPCLCCTAKWMKK